MKIIDKSSKILINDKLETLTPKSLDGIEGRIWYDFYKHNFLNFVNEEFGDNSKTNDDKAKLTYHLRNIFRVNSRSLIDDYNLIVLLMRNKPIQSWQFTLKNYNGDPIKIIAASMRGNKFFDNLVKDALMENGASKLNDKRSFKFTYQEWCLILGVDYKTLINNYLTL